MGLETLTKLIKLEVLIIGMRGLGVEVAKNLILAGPKSVTILDPTMVKIEDLSSNFFLQESHVGKQSRGEACVSQLGELNPSVNVSAIKEIDDLNKYSVVVVTEHHMKSSELMAMNEKVRARGGGFIIAESLGPAGYAFLDYGDSHKVFDLDGEQTKQFIVSNITNAEEAVCTVHEDKRHSYQDGDYVKFVEVEGMTEINEQADGTNSHIKIKNCKPYQFTLEIDSTNFSAHTRQGVVENNKKTQAIEFHSLKQSIENPTASSQYGMLETCDLRFFGRSDQIHVGVRALYAFYDEMGRYPNGSDAEVNQVL
jgi:ubiquitin-activating enzyme E1